MLYESIHKLIVLRERQEGDPAKLINNVAMVRNEDRSVYDRGIHVIISEK